jgi:hypothetical protein
LYLAGMSPGLCRIYAHLRTVVPEFSEWYSQKQEEMRNDPLMRYFAKLRTSIEKKAHTPTTVGVHIKSFSGPDFQRFGPAPPGAESFFMGDQNGGSGWHVPKSDGTTETYYVELPAEIGEVNLHLPDTAAVLGTPAAPAAVLVAEYLKKLGTLVREARLKFGGS